MTLPHIDPSALPPPDLLALARRGASHDVNNLLAVIQGNLQLMTICRPEQLRAVCDEIDLACERLALLSDGWMLADPDPPPDDLRCGVADALRHVVSVLRATQEADIRVVSTPHEDAWEAGFDARRLRALLHCALVNLLRRDSRRAVDVALVGRDAGCSVHLQIRCEPQHQPVVVAPGGLASVDARTRQSVTVGLWDVAQCLDRHGSGMRVHYAQGQFDLWLDLSPSGA